MEVVALELFEAINNRRSIRKFIGREVESEKIKQILQAGIEAPSSKNRQPWRFIVVTGSAKAAMLEVMEKRMDALEAAVSPGEKAGISWVRNSMGIMEQAPVTILILNRESECLVPPGTEMELFRCLTDTQSLGAAIQNMTLAATGLGLGSLWICDILFACRELCQWLGTDQQLIAALSVGYADEAPARRPRNDLNSITDWLA